MKKKQIILLPLFISSVVFCQNIITQSDPAVTTHYIQSGTLKLGINSNAGGAINFLEMPGIGNIFGPQSRNYGRMGQSAIRDELHGEVFNPTQAGFNENLGTPCTIDVSADALVIVPRNCALWYGDGRYDFIEWENLGADPYGNDGGQGDSDKIDESALLGKQDEELRSEFDYYGKYVDYSNKGGINIPCIRHYYEYRFVRQPGHCLSQFGEGTPNYDNTKLYPDISKQYPTGVHKAEQYDMSYFSNSFHIRHDVANWDPGYHYTLDSQNNWIIENRTGVDIQLSKLADSLSKPYQRFFIISESNDPNVGPAMGIWMPYNDFNNYNVVGVDQSSGNIIYKDARGNDAGTYRSCRSWDTRYRVPSMSLWGFKMDLTGIINRTRLEPNIYETFRHDVYIFMGTPNEIFANIQKIQNAKYTWHFINSLEGWTLDNNLTGTASSSILSITKTGTDPFMYAPDNLLIDADNQKFITIRLKNNTAATGASFHFRTYNSGVLQNVTFTITGNDSEYKTYVIDMSQNPAWKGVIKNLRFDPPGTSGNMQIDYISVNTDMAPADPILAEPANKKTEIDAMQLFTWEKVNIANTYQLQISKTIDFSTIIENVTALTDTFKTITQLNNNTTYYWRVKAIGTGGPGLWSTTRTFTTKTCWTEGKEWLMNQFAGWNTTPSAGIGNLAISNGILSYNVLNDDPNILSTTGLGYCTSNNPHLKIRVKNNTAGTVARVYFKKTTQNTSWVGNFVSQNISANDADFKEYIFDMSMHADWTSSLDQLRLDLPNNASSGSVELDYVKLGDFVITEVNETIEAVNQDVLIYPNPANDEIIIKVLSIKNIEALCKIEITDMQGSVVLSFSNSQISKSSNSFDISSLASGMYIIKCTNKENTVTQKFIKQ